ncbi:ABC transporter ATP-binding protein [Phyllobacterium sp. P30BS-XVII]|uniref:ABC transporter ATP-binding protein n=1 Tax=Phyllobacterium sp. P30BS-XVII TaxID=2587046 RepID=UPI0013AF05CF|nr:ABC transporter ATP-binding protein [Phyllobacterium sp. P30BS-XVII]MBA8903861.1 ABC-type Fe3+/spermidine/putrescine transport system ATPase subunit [Phyllobacterium sp. P30BS-XVII]
MASLAIQQISKIFPNGHKALDDITIDVASGEFLTLLGPSGCGKTTLLKAIAGFHSVLRGRFLIDGKDVTALPPEQRDTAMCFQSYALFPHMTVAENILFGPKQSRLGKAECDARLAVALRQVDLAPHVAKLPSALSGGQQQRVALARAMAMRPGIILFDEPLSNLDARLREQVRYEIRSLQAEYGFTALYVTHDRAEALAMSDRIAVLNNGRIEQIGVPSDIYDKPKNCFVANFIGIANILEANFIRQVGESTWRAHTGIGEMDISSRIAPLAPSHYICWRPEDAEVLINNNVSQANVFTATVTAQAFQGNVTDVLIRSRDGAPYRIQTRKPLAIGSTLSLRLDPSNFSILEAIK